MENLKQSKHKHILCSTVFVIARVMVKLYEKKMKCSTSYITGLMGSKPFHQEALREYCKLVF